MKIKALSLSVVAALSLGLAANANAADMTTTAPATNGAGWYIGANTGMINAADHATVAGPHARRSAQAIGVNAGYAFNQNVSVYSSYDYANKLTTPNEQAQLNMGTIGVKGNYYLTQNLSVFGKVGATYIHAVQKNAFGTSKQLKHDTFAPTVGAGVQYNITPSVSTEVGYNFYRDALKTEQGDHQADLNQAYWGMTYKFGQPSNVQVITKNVEVVKQVQVPVQVATSTNHIVAFANGSHSLTKTSRFTLAQVIDVMNKHPQLNGQLIGRTSNTGPAALNQRLSAQRANVVAQFLEANGIAASRLHIQSVADSSPLAQNAPALERSVQIILH
jgi:OOP family OmpA-OmpF porin